MATHAWYKKISANSPLQQGDLFVNLKLPKLEIEDFSSEKSINGSVVLKWNVGSFVVLTQSCDLEGDNGKDLGRVTLAPVFTVDQFIVDNPEYSKGDWGNLVDNKLGGFHVFPSPDSTLYGDSNLLVAVFYHTYLIDLDALVTLSQTKGYKTRHRLLSPYLEVLSQRFGLLYSRVAIPEQLFPPASDRSEIGRIANIIKDSMS
jgi:hypothetical protein